MFVYTDCEKMPTKRPTPTNPRFKYWVLNVILPKLAPPSLRPTPPPSLLQYLISDVYENLMRLFKITNNPFELIRNPLNSLSHHIFHF